MAEVHLPPTLTPLFAGLPRTVEVEAGSVLEAIRELDRSWPGLLDRVCLSGPRLRPHMNAYVDGAGADLQTALGEFSRLDVVAAISGG